MSDEPKAPKRLPGFASMSESIAYVRQFYPKAKLMLTLDRDAIGRQCYGVSRDGTTAPEEGVASSKGEAWKTFAWGLQANRDALKAMAAGHRAAGVPEPKENPT